MSNSHIKENKSLPPPVGGQQAGPSATSQARGTSSQRRAKRKRDETEAPSPEGSPPRTLQSGLLPHDSSAHKSQRTMPMDSSFHAMEYNYPGGGLPRLEMGGSMTWPLSENRVALNPSHMLSPATEYEFRYYPLVTSSSPMISTSSSSRQNQNLGVNLPGTHVGGNAYVTPGTWIVERSIHGEGPEESGKLLKPYKEAPYQQGDDAILKRRQTGPMFSPVGSVHQRMNTSPQHGFQMSKINKERSNYHSLSLGQFGRGAITPPEGVIQVGETNRERSIPVYHHSRRGVSIRSGFPSTSTAAIASASAASIPRSNKQRISIGSLPSSILSSTGGGTGGPGGPGKLVEQGQVQGIREPPHRKSDDALLTGKMPDQQQQQKPGLPFGQFGGGVTAPQHVIQMSEMVRDRSNHHSRGGSAFQATIDSSGNGHPREHRKRSGPELQLESSKRSPPSDERNIRPPPASLRLPSKGIPTTMHQFMSPFMESDEAKDSKLKEQFPPGFDYDPNLPMNLQYQLLGYKREQKRQEKARQLDKPPSKHAMHQSPSSSSQQQLPPQQLESSKHSPPSDERNIRPPPPPPASLRLPSKGIPTTTISPFPGKQQN